MRFVVGCFHYRYIEPLSACEEILAAPDARLLLQYRPVRFGDHHCRHLLGYNNITPAHEAGFATPDFQKP